MASRKETAEVEVKLSSDQANAEIKKLQTEASKLSKELSNMGKDDAGRKKLASDINNVENQITKLQKSVKEDLRLVINGDTAGKSINTLNAALSQLRRELKSVAADSDAFKEKSAQAQTLKGKIDQLNTSISGNKGFWSGLSAEVKQFGLMAAGYLGFQAISSQISNIINKNAQLSDSLADIRMTTGLSAEEVQNLNSQLGKIDTRTSKQALLDIVKVAGQFGVAKDDIVGFTEVMNKASVVLGSEFSGGAEEIATTLAKLRNVMGDIKTSRIDNDLSHIGNALVVLAQEGVATAPVVAEFAQRISGVGITLGLTSGQVLGLSATMQELGVSTERGGTAIGKILQKMTTNTVEFAKVAGVPLKEFEHQVNTDIYGAFLKFVEGSKKGGDSAIAFANILKDSEIAGAGASEVIAKLSNNQALLAQRTALASTALTNSGAITEQYAIKNETFGAELDKLSKKIFALFSNSSVTGFFTSLVSGLNSLFDTTPKFEKLNEEWRSMSTTTDKLEKSLNPLLTRYDELQAKTSLTSVEQTELKSIIKQVADTVPTAVTEFDKYGNALDINTSKAREFIKAQQELTAFKNGDAIKESEQALSQFEGLLAGTVSKMNRLVKDGKQEVYDARGNLIGEVKVSNQDIIALEKDAEKYKKTIEGLKLVLRELKGLPLVDKTEAPPTPVKTVTDKTVDLNAETPEQIKARIKKEKEAELNALKEFDALMKKYQEEINTAKNLAIEDQLQRELAQRQTAYDKELADAREQLQKLLDNQLTTDEQRVAASTKEYELEYALEDKYQADKAKLIADWQKKQDDAEYKQSQDNLDRMREQKQAALDKLYGDGAITQKQFNEQSYELDLQILQAKLSNAQDYGVGVAELLAKISALQKQHAADDAAVEAEKWKTILTHAQNGFNQLADILGKFNTISANRNVKHLNDLKAVDDAERKHQQDMLNKKLISRETYDANIAALDQFEAERKKKAALEDFKAQQKLAIAIALVNAALAASGAFVANIKTPPSPFVAIGAAALALGKGLLEVGVIKSTPPPTFAVGGNLPTANGGVTAGASHAAGGIDLIDTTTGRLVGNVQGGEPILSGSTYANNKEVVDALLYASMYKGGARVPVVPAYATGGSLPQLNYSRVIENTQAQRYGYSSVSQPIPYSQEPNKDNKNTTDPLQLEMLSLMRDTRDVLKDVKDAYTNPKRIEAYIVLQKLNDQIAAVERVKSNAKVG